MDRLGRFDKDGYKNSFSKGELAKELVYMNRDYDNLEQQVKKQQQVIDKAIEYILECSINEKGHINVSLSSEEVGKLLDILNEALE